MVLLKLGISLEMICAEQLTIHPIICYPDGNWIDLIDGIRSLQSSYTHHHDFL